MTIEALVTILGMAAVTFGIRAGGYLLAERLPDSGFFAAWLRYIPGAVLAALVAPALAEGGPAEWIAAAATALVFALSRSLLAAIAGGVLTVWLVRLALGG